VREEPQAVTRAEICKAARRVVRSFHAAEEPLLEQLGSRVLLRVGTHFSSTEYESFCDAVRSAGDESFYLAYPEEFVDDLPSQWLLPLDDYEFYSKHVRRTESAHISPAGKWVALFGDEFYAIAGSTEPEFVRLLLQGFEAPADEQARWFVRHWRQTTREWGREDDSLARVLLTHAYGREKAQELLAS
jgi:hypothetical protein